MTWGAIASAAVGAGVSLYGAKKQSDAVKKAGQAATPVPYSGSGPMGGVYFDPATKQYTAQLADSPFYNMFTGLGLSQLGNAATAPGSFLYGADPELAAAYQGLTGQGIVDAAQGRYDTLSQLAAPQEQRAFQGLENRLFARGQMGTSGGGVQYEAFQNAANQADLQRQLAAQDWAQTNAVNRFQGALGAVGSGQAGQMNQYNIGSGTFGNLLNAVGSLYGQGNLGLGAASGMPSNVAMAQAQAAGQPYQIANQFLQNSGAYDWLGGKLGGLFGGRSPTPGAGVAYSGTPPPITPNTSQINIPTQPITMPKVTYDFGGG